MGKSLAGTLFCYCGNKYDYNYKESIQCLLDFCDHVIVVAGGDDGTIEEVIELASKNEDKINVIIITEEEWLGQVGKEKLNYFTNVAIQYADKLGFEYQFNLQADEILHENSYQAVRDTINTGGEAFMCKRINLWKTPYYELNVPHDRLPCSSEIIRLAKSNYRSYGDAESINAPANFDFVNKIQIWHYGFVRDKKIMKDKVINMQENVFGIEHDPKLDGIDIFEPDRWFNPATDLKIIDNPHPKIMQGWIKTRP